VAQAPTLDALGDYCHRPPPESVGAPFPRAMCPDSDGRGRIAALRSPNASSPQQLDQVADDPDAELPFVARSFSHNQKCSTTSMDSCAAAWSTS
jgi:hypothetical protein